MAVVRVKLDIAEGSNVLRSLSATQACDEWSTEKFEVATGVTEGDMTPRNIATLQHIYAETDQNVTFLFAASGTAITVNAGGIVLVTQTSETVLLITNASGNTANIMIIAGGT